MRGENILSRVEKGFAKTVRWETINFPLQQIMKYHLRLPFPHAPKVLSRNPKMWVNKTPILEHPAVLIAIPEWEGRYGTKSYAVDVKEGYIYAVRSEDWERLVERAYVATDEPLESSQVTPVEKETSGGKVQTLDSKERVPIAESTRKDLKEPVLKYPDPSKSYTLFTDASKYAWACVLTQEYEHEFDGKIKKILHPITYVSGLFKGSYSYKRSLCYLYVSKEIVLLSPGC